MPFTKVQDKPFKIVSGIWYLVSGIRNTHLSSPCPERLALSLVEGSRRVRSQTWRRMRPGFSFVEILISLLLAVAIITIVFTSSSALFTRRNSDLSSVAAKITSKDIEYLRSLDYASLPASTPSNSCENGQPGQFSGNGLPQDINNDIQKLKSGCLSRSIVNYSAVCSPLPASCDVKQVTVTVTWKNNNGTNQSTSLDTLIYKNGL